MSFMKGAKEFFGFGPDTTEYDPYYDEPGFADDGSAAYAPELNREPAYSRAPEVPARGPRSYAPAIVVVEPRTFDDAKEIGDPFRDGDAVVFDMTNLDKSARKRLVDFSSGLCFALRGQMHNLGKYSDSGRTVFAVVPENARTMVSDLERAVGLR